MSTIDVYHRHPSDIHRHAETFVGWPRNVSHDTMVTGDIFGVRAEQDPYLEYSPVTL